MPWGDNHSPGYTFDLPLKQVRALEEATGFGCGMLLLRLQDQSFKVNDFRETILQGLIGGGLPPLKAAALVQQYVDDRPAAESILPAQAILMAWMIGAPKKAGEPPETPAPMTGREGSTLPQSTAPEQP